MKCEFCQGELKPLYEVPIGNRPLLGRCTKCHSCQLTSALPQADIDEYYRTSYFAITPDALMKSRILARDYLRKTSNYAAKCSDSRVLEIGPGFGHFAAAIAARTGVSVDVVEPSEQCQQYMRAKYPRLRMVGTDVRDLVQSSGVYDRVYCFHVVEHLQTTASFIDGVYRVLKPGGIAVFMTPNATSESFRRLGARWGWACPSQHLQFWGTRMPWSYFEAHGFEVLALRDVLPAAIHFPSFWREKAADRISRLSESYNSRSFPSREIVRVLRRPLVEAWKALEQNRREYGALTIERAIASTSHKLPADELMVVLRRCA
jgi:cyclopropane fatty-acyl-phospholipid synthase-like methyltransferase